MDWTLKRIRTTRFDAPVVVLGDSVAHGVFLDWHDRPDTMAMLACSAATETAGQYFLLQRYLKANRPPGAVVCSDGMPFFGNLENRLMENYIQRCFTHWSEIADLLAVKKTRCSPSKWSRTRLAHLAVPAAPSTGHSRVHQFGRVLRFHSRRHRGKSVRPRSFHPAVREARWSQGEHLHPLLKRMMASCRSADIPFYYWPPPVQADGENRVRTTMARFQVSNPNTTTCGFWIRFFRCTRPIASGTGPI